jgi:RNA polymerase sigma-70 factor (ECF subfamily)
MSRVYSPPTTQKPDSPSTPSDFRSIFETYGPFVARTLRQLEVPSADRHDLSQEIFVIVHRKLHEYDGRTSLRSWIYGICVRMASTYRRSARVRREQACGSPEPALSPSHDAANHDHDLDSRRAFAHAEALLAKIDDEKRRVFVLYEIEGLSMIEVAEEVGCPLQTAYSRLHAARRGMKVLLQRSRLVRAVSA